MLYYTAAPATLPISTDGLVTAVANADGSATVIAGADAFLRAAHDNRPANITLVANDDTSVVAAACDVPGVKGTPSAAEIAALILAPTKTEGNPLYNVPADTDYNALQRGAFGIWRTDSAGVPHKMGTTSPMAPLG